MSFSWSKFEKPLVGLAPMAGYTDTVFRQLVKELAPSALTISELASATAMAHRGEKTLKLVRFKKIERPYLIQLFGHEPEMFAEAVKIVEKDLKPDGIDINMGCPAKKAIRSGNGSALMKNPKLAAEIVRACRENTSLPLSVKTRLGWSDPNEILEFGPKLIKAGAEALFIHGRTYAQAFRGKADWTNIYKLKELVDVPVIGNGDIDSKESFDEKLKNLDGGLVGRATFGNPWLIGKITGEAKLPDDFKERLKLIYRHADLAEEDGGIHGMMELRKHLVTYVKGLDGAKALREKLIHVESAKEVRQIFEDYFVN